MATSDNNDHESTYEQGTYFALIFNEIGEKEAVLYGTDLKLVREAIHDMQEDSELEYIILQVVENPGSRALH